MMDGFLVLKENDFEPRFLCSIRAYQVGRQMKTFQMCKDSEILSTIVLSLKVTLWSVLRQSKKGRWRGPEPGSPTQ